MSDNINQIPITVVKNSKPSSQTAGRATATPTSLYPVSAKVLTNGTTNGKVTSAAQAAVNGNESDSDYLDLEDEFIEVDHINNGISVARNGVAVKENVVYEDEKGRVFATMNHAMPRRHRHHHHTRAHHHRYETLLLRELMQLNIKREKIEMALAATGYQRSIDAINWLMKHSKDPILMQDVLVSTRDYIIVLCPVHRLAAQIATFFQQSRLKCGPNEAHYNNMLPFFKLSSFFRIPDSEVCNMHKAFDLIFKPKNANNAEDTTMDESIGTKKHAASLLNQITEINVDLHVTPQMVLLYPDIDSENAIKELMISFNKFLAKSTKYEMQTYTKQLHLTLAYNFDPEQKRTLEDLAVQHINYRQPSGWEVRLYSRDIRAESKLTYRTLATFKPKAENELYLKVNDYVFAVNSNSKDNIMKGISHATGESGYFPSKNVERAVESDTWRLHKSSVLVTDPAASSLNASGTSAKLLPLQENPRNQQQPIQATKPSVSKSQAELNYTGQQHSDGEHSIPLTMLKRFQELPKRAKKLPGYLKFFILRHGERVDLAFGPQWIEQSFDKNGKYRRINLNMPADVPFKATKRDFVGDSPLTEIGHFQSRLTGDALGHEAYRIHYCYVSPALRCIQTAHSILKAQGLEKTIKIRIEPSLFEFIGWYDKGLPSFLGFDPLVKHGYNIDVNYKPLLSLERLQRDENYTDYYQRNFNIVKYFTNMHQNEGGNILIIGHAGTLEACTRQISGFPVRPYSEFNAVIRKVPYLGLCLLEKEATSHKFEIQPSVILPIGHTANFNFDPNSLKS